MNARAETRNFDFVETGFTRRMDFMVIRYLATNNDLPIKNRLRSQSNVAKVSCICESMCNAFVPRVD
jgi:hypothetical protein